MLQVLVLVQPEKQVELFCIILEPFVSGSSSASVSSVDLSQHLKHGSLSRCQSSSFFYVRCSAEQGLETHHSGE